MENAMISISMPSKIDKGKAPSAAGDSPAVDPAIWKALAFQSPNFPSAGSAVYYFAEGHAEQCCSHPAPHLFLSIFPCHLAAVNLHADPTTEQVFAVFSLNTDFSSPTTSKTSSGDGVTSVVKTLWKGETSRKSKSVLTLPASAHEVFCYSGDDLDVYDLNNRRWTFRHMVRGSPPLHFLTNGWGHFVSSKMLVAGDEVVFVRDADGLIFVGCRRFDGDECTVIDMNMESSSSLITKKLRKKREEEDMVKEAMRWVLQDGEGMVEGRYYPDNKLPVYVVKKEVVENAMRVQWKRGMRVQKNSEMADGFKSWLLGTVRALSPQSIYTPWRMLEVIWDETGEGTLENPWDVKPLRVLITEEEIQNLY